MEESEGLSLIQGACALPSAFVLQLSVDKDTNTQKETEEEEGSSLSLPFLPLPKYLCLGCNGACYPTQSLCSSLHLQPGDSHVVVPLFICPSGFVSRTHLRYVCALFSKWK